MTDSLTSLPSACVCPRERVYGGGETRARGLRRRHTSVSVNTCEQRHHSRRCWSPAPAACALGLPNSSLRPLHAAYQGCSLR